MQQRQISIKQLFITGTILVLTFMLVFFLEVVFYDPLYRITNKKDHLIECTVVGFETGDNYTSLDSMFLKYYSVLKDADGNIIKIQRTNKDYGGRKVMIYMDGSARHGVRKDYEFKKMNLFDYACIIMFLPMIWLEIRMVTVCLKKKKEG